jgi:hypothetical protein
MRHALAWTVTALACCAAEVEPGTVRFSKRRLFVSTYQAAAIADINRDGRPDIVSGPYWFAAPDFVPQSFRANESAADYVHSNSDLPYDVDGDHWVDIIVGAWGEQGVLWYRNPGPMGLKLGTPWEKHSLTATKGKIERTDLHDYDGDGTPEIHTISYVKQEPSDVYRLTRGPDGKPAVTKIVLGLQGGGHGYAWGDVNGDGREDFLTEAGWYERPAGDPFAGPWKLHSETALPHPSCPFAVMDVNGDGRLDILFGRAHDYGIYWWEQVAPQPDGTTAWKKHIIDESWSQGHVVGLADLDGDGVQELVTGKCVYAHNGRDPGAEDPAVFYYYRWHQRTSSFSRHTVAGPGENIGLGRQLAMGDLNDDGRIDIVAPGRFGLWLMINQGNDRPAVSQRSGASRSRRR